MELTVPKVGLTVETLEVVAWHKQPGEEVRAGENVCDLAADKADVGIEAPAAGVLAEIRAGEGATVVPGEVLGIIAVGGEPGADLAPAGPAAAAPPAASPNGHGEEGRVRASPLARRVAADRGIAVEALTGSGPRGRVVLRDVQAAADTTTTDATPPVADAPPVAGAPPVADAVPDPGPSAEPPAGHDFVEVRWTAARRATARAMAHSAATVAPVTLHRRAGADAAMAAVRRLKGDGLPATFTHAVLAATAHALAGHPALNAIWDGPRLLRGARRHVGLAVDDGGDLLLGVVQDADRLDTVGLVLAAVEAVARARGRETAAAPPTFTISNLGMLGVEQFTPIVSPPAIAVLGVGAVVDGRCHLSLTFDHRAVDGAPAARFLADLCDRLQTYDGR